MIRQMEVLVQRTRIWLPLLVVFVAAVASGCSPDNVPPPATATPTYTPEPQPVESESDQPQAEDPASDAPPEPTPFDLNELHATDPTSVNLSSGKPTLVEFFAFW